MSEVPIQDLTEEEEEHLKAIREYLGKGYIRGYCVRMLHVCPKCGQARGWKNMIECSSCGHRLSSPREYLSLERKNIGRKFDECS